MIQSIQRAIMLMRQFSEETPTLGVTELSQRLDLHKSTVSRILSTLETEGLVYQHPETGKYSLGMGLVSLAGVALGQLSVRGTALPFLETLAQSTQETLCLITREGDNGVCIAHLDSPQPVRYVSWLGRRTPLHCTASGKVLLAFAPNAVQAQALAADSLKAYTPNTQSKPETLRQTLAQVQTQGYALEEAEFVLGIVALAVPIFNHAGQVVASLSVAGPEFRLPTEKLTTFTAELQATARQISHQLGYGGPYPPGSSIR